MARTLPGSKLAATPLAEQPVTPMGLTKTRLESPAH
jgi:hypothetical protein